MKTLLTRTKQETLFGDDDPFCNLRQAYIEPPFSVLDGRAGGWRARKNAWIALGIQSEQGRSEASGVWGGNTYAGNRSKQMQTVGDIRSVFDPALCEVLYNWFCAEGGTVLDPFAGGSVRGIVAQVLGFRYTGIELRPEQVASNQEQARAILPEDCQPSWLVGDSDKVLDVLEAGKIGDFGADFVFSCPPYGNLEVYSKLPGDISNMTYEGFLAVYKSIITKCGALLKSGGYACFVVGDFRDKKGYYRGFVADTIYAFQNANMGLYNDMVLLTAVGSAPFRVNGQMPKSQKVVKIHQNVLVFKKR